MSLPSPESIAAPVQPDEAIAFWAWKSAMSAGDVRKLADGARERAFYVAFLTELSAVQTVKDALHKAIADGETLRDFTKRIAEVAQSQGWDRHRIETIFRNNVQTAYAAGRYAKMQAVKVTRPFWQYFTVGDGRVRPSHGCLNQEVRHADDPFWSQHYPPNGHKCRCGVCTLSERQVRNSGLTVSNGPLETRLYTDPATGMEYHVAFPGADHGWRSNPGKTWQEEIRGLCIERLEADPAIAPHAIRRLVEGGFEFWTKNPSGEFPLVALSEKDAKRIGARAVIGRLSAETWQKQVRHHPELTLKDYLRAQDAIERGERLQQDARNIAFTLDEPEGVVVVVKATIIGDKLYVTSLRRLSRDDAERDRTLRKLRRGRKKADDGA